MTTPHIITARQIGAYTVYDYSPLSFFVTGDTKPIKENLALLGGKYNNLEVIKGTGQRIPGWIFSKKHLPQVEAYLTGGQVQIPQRAIMPAPVLVPLPAAPLITPFPVAPPVTSPIPVSPPMTPSQLLFTAIEKFNNAVVAYRTPIAKVYTRQSSPELIEVVISGPRQLAEAELTTYMGQFPDAYVKMRTLVDDYLVVLLTRIGQME